MHSFMLIKDIEDIYFIEFSSGNVFITVVVVLLLERKVCCVCSAHKKAVSYTHLTLPTKA